MNLHTTDITLDAAVVDFIDDKLVILAGPGTISVTLGSAVVDEIRDELNTEYRVRPATEDALFIDRLSDNVTVVATSDIPESTRGWGFTFLAHVQGRGRLGRFGGESAIQAAKKAFHAYDEAARFEAETAEAAS